MQGIGFSAIWVLFTSPPWEIVLRHWLQGMAFCQYELLNVSSIQLLMKILYDIGCKKMSFHQYVFLNVSLQSISKQKYTKQTKISKQVNLTWGFRRVYPNIFNMNSPITTFFELVDHPVNFIFEGNWDITILLNKIWMCWRNISIWFSIFLMNRSILLSSHTI